MLNCCKKWHKKKDACGVGGTLAAGSLNRAKVCSKKRRSKRRIYRQNAGVFPCFSLKAGETAKTRACERQASGQIGGYGTKLVASKPLSRNGSRGRWDACPHIAGGYSLSGVELGEGWELSRSMRSSTAFLIYPFTESPVF